MYTEYVVEWAGVLVKWHLMIVYTTHLGFDLETVYIFRLSEKKEREREADT